MSERILAHLFDVVERDIKLYRMLQGSGGMRANDIASLIQEDYTTTYRSLERCMRAGLVFREKRTYRRGGRYYLYEATPPEVVAERALALLEGWTASARRTIRTLAAGGGAHSRGEPTE